MYNFDCEWALNHFRYCRSKSNYSHQLQNRMNKPTRPGINDSTFSLSDSLQTHLTALWRYMYHMYQLDAFTQSCPADQDIINHYKLQQVRNLPLCQFYWAPISRISICRLQSLKMKKHEELETPTFTTYIPIDISE